MAIVKDRGRWYEVLPCPSQEMIAGARKSKADLQRQEDQARKIVALPNAKWRTEALALIKSGHRVDAIRHVSSATGEELAFARVVAELLVTPAN